MMPIWHLQVARQHDIAYFYHEMFDAAWKGQLRTGTPAGADGVGDGPALADEHFGLFSADRRTNKQLLP